jgi:bacterioferritin
MRPLRPHHPAHHGRSAGRCRTTVVLRGGPEPVLNASAIATLKPSTDRARPIAVCLLIVIIKVWATTCGADPHCRSAIMKGDPGVIDFLNKGLRHELTAINQYWLHYRLLDNWGYKALAKQWRKESIEEMQHADKLVERIIFLDGFPNMQVLDPLHIGQNVKEVLDCDLAAEISARLLYQEAATHCHGVKDYVTRDLFEKLMHDEEEHIDFLETQLDLVAKLGLELYAQHHIGELEEDED